MKHENGAAEIHFMRVYVDPPQGMNTFSIMVLEIRHYDLLNFIVKTYFSQRTSKRTSTDHFDSLHVAKVIRDSQNNPILQFKVIMSTIIITYNYNQRVSII